MWNRLTLRLKITILTALALSFVAVGITGLSIYNAGRIFIITHEDFTMDGYSQTIVMPVDSLPDGFQPTIELLEGLERNVRESRSHFRNYSIAIAAAFVVIGTLAAYFISGHTLKPIKTLARKMEEIDTHNLTSRIKLPQAHDEVSSLVRSFNSMLEKLSRSFESQRFFAQNAAHELKTPLTSIRASIEVLKLDDKPSIEDYMETVDIVNAGAERLIELVEGLLSLNNTTEEMKWQTFSGKEVFENIINELRDDITQKGLSVDLSGDCRVKGDKTLLERAFFNLIHNAIRYNVKDGKVKITLSDNNISIEDSGAGIPVESLEHIFEPFYCVDKSRSKYLGGHGLGMAIAKNIFEKHNIEIRISSEIGQGTKIFLSRQEI